MGFRIRTDSEEGGRSEREHRNWGDVFVVCVGSVPVVFMLYIFWKLFFEPVFLLLRTTFQFFVEVLQ